MYLKGDSFKRAAQPETKMHDRCSKYLKVHVPSVAIKIGVLARISQQEASFRNAH